MQESQHTEWKESWRDDYLRWLAQKYFGRNCGRNCGQNSGGNSLSLDCDAVQSAEEVAQIGKSIRVFAQVNGINWQNSSCFCRSHS